MRDTLCAVTFAVLLLFSVQLSNSSTTYNLQVGAFGDLGSNGNLGVRAEIRTNIYRLAQSDSSDSFWVGDNIGNDAGIQFGYILLAPGTYCDKGKSDPAIPFTCAGGSVTVDGSEALWFWQYWPNISANVFYFGDGLAGSELLNGTWHTYTILAASQGGWNFLLDGHQVANANFPLTGAASKAYFAAEKVTSSTTPGSLGPVEFRNLAYLKEDGWHLAMEFYAIVNCAANPNCIPIPYGVSLLGPNHIIAGTSVPQPKDGELLWNNAVESTQTTPIMSTTSTSTTIGRNMPELLFGGLAVAILGIFVVFEFVVLSRRKHTKRYR